MRMVESEAQVACLLADILQKEGGRDFEAAALSQLQVLSALLQMLIELIYAFIWLISSHRNSAAVLFFSS